MTAQPASAQAPTLTQAVTAKLLNRATSTPGFSTATARDTQVNVMRKSAKGWAFGSAVLVAPKKEGAAPEGWLFLAHRKAGSWQITFEGESAFRQLSTRAPIVAGQEKKLFADMGTPKKSDVTPMYAGGDYRTGMRLPFAVGQSWYMTGGPHGWSGSDTPYSAIDLSGGDGRVLAARGGTAYTMCGNGRGWIRVIHDRGYSTDYYHLYNNIAANGLGVGEGAFLGNIGNDVSCGGSSSGAHVHFALRQNSAYVPVHGHNYGKWVIIPGSGAYQGYALHGSAQVNVGGLLYNYGALGFTQGVVDAYGGGSVNKRSGPGTGYGLVGTVGDGATVSIACSANGTTHTGRWGTTSLWNKLTDGTWVSDAYLWTGLSGPVNGWC
ncbi:peptidoglycan DD-metalloendopeptidase family protein [Actinomadura alba]|uniref:Peptidoglycan DD-metalloendopeptidase family protein n=2 Tax=Actinomadura alba TaxID=406431 RepID=A0ABR7LR57_9ACTN|nr:peptidoglycan DD-metalloendopeptidase family protein [Actinomadura alba]